MKKAKPFTILAAVCLAILILDFLFPFIFINEKIAMSVGIVGLTGVITGIIGIFTRLKDWKRLPYTGALLSVISLGIIITTIIPSLNGIITPESGWILIGIQLLITITLIGIGIMNKRENRLTKAILTTSAIALTILCIPN